VPDWPVLVQAVAAFVQAAAAVVIVRLTIRLAKANDALVKATDSYAGSARDQVDELVKARLADPQRGPSSQRSRAAPPNGAICG
jgi:hypothetical protein